MKKGILVVGNQKKINIGDYIQAIASAQFVDEIDVYIEREELNHYNGDDVKIIMNGWFMHNPNNWPPSEKIHPLFLAFHINSLAKEKLLSQESINYLKKLEPIGCRDNYTVELLKEKGVNAFFSGCLTMTLGMKYCNTNKTGKYFIVDPFYFVKWNARSILETLFHLIFHLLTIVKIAKKNSSSLSIKNLLNSGFFYSVYSKIFSKEILAEANYIHHQSESFNSIKTTDGLLNKAKELINEYAQASLVITSRIHCALPCVSIGTPVIYIENSNQTEASACRLNGLRDFFNILRYEKNSLKTDLNFNRNKKISVENFPSNKIDYLKYSELLISRCKSFFKE
jgi:hypothetical protein